MGLTSNRMRLIRRKLYRAFQELDHFSDAQCEVFLASVTSDSTRKVWMLISRAAAAILVMALWLRGYGWWRDILLSGSGWTTAWMLVVVLTSGGLAWLLVRDLLCRRWIRRALMVRGSCHRCRYSLAGLPIVGLNSVICPECGVEMEVSADCVVTTTGAVELRRFLPMGQLGVLEPTPWWTPRRRRVVWRTTVALVTIVIAAAVVFELFLRWQGIVAEGDRMTRAEFDALLVDAAAPAGSENRLVAWEALDRVNVKLNSALQEVWEWHRLIDNNPAHLTARSPVDLLYRSGFAYGDVSQAEGHRESARRIVQACAARGVFDDLAALVAAPTPRRVVQFDPTRHPNFSVWGGWHVNELAQLNLCRMRIAIEANDAAEICRAIDEIFALARMYSAQPSGLGWMSASEISRCVRELSIEWLSAPNAAEWIDCLERTLNRQDPMPPPSIAIRTISVLQASFLAWVFENPDRVRFGARSMEQVQEIDSSVTNQSGWFAGTYAWHKQECAGLFAPLLAVVDQDIGVAADPRSMSRSLFAQNLEFGLLHYRAMANTSWAWERGSEIAIAIERFRRRAGEYPESLDQLVPEFLETLPKDPFTGLNFNYARLESAADGRKRYALDSVGPRSSPLFPGAGNGVEISPSWMRLAPSGR